MYSTKSFCNVLALASNQPGVVSPIGELTTYGKTFSKEVGYYHHQSIDGYELINLFSDTEGVKSAMAQTNVNQAISLVNHVVQATLTTTGELFFDETLLQLKQHGETIDAEAIDIGSMVQSGTRWVPQWISWSDAGTAGENTHKVWLSLDAFINQYTDYELVVVPPFDDLDSFFNPGTIVENRVKAITPSQMIERMEEAKDGYPETFIRTDAYEYRDPVIAARRFDVYWTVLGYGLSANDPDIIREKLIDYILENSTHTRDEWAVIFPDIFRRTEFIFAPFWDKYASEQRVFDHGIYSPIVGQADPLTWLQSYAFGYSSDHIKASGQLMGFPYRSIMIPVVGHIENRDGKTKITDHYPDFINVGTDSTDFARMSTPTQTWANVMMDLIISAESLDNSTDLPRGTYRVIRDGKVFLAKSHNRVLLLVLAKSNTIDP